MSQFELLNLAEDRIDEFRNSENTAYDDAGAECYFLTYTFEGVQVGIKWYGHRTSVSRVEAYVKAQRILHKEGLACKVIYGCVEYKGGFYYLTEVAPTTRFDNFSERMELYRQFEEILPEPPRYIEIPGRDEWSWPVNPVHNEWYEFRREWCNEQDETYLRQVEIGEMLQVLALEGLIEGVSDVAPRNWGIDSEGNTVILDMGCAFDCCLQSRDEYEADIVC